MDLKRTQLAQEMQGKKNLKKPASLTHWQVYKAVSWRRDAVKDYHEHTSTVIESTSFCTKFWAEAITWIIPGMIGFLTAAVGSIIEVVVEVLADLRFGFCKTSPYFKSMERCDDFHFWNAASKGDVPIIEWDWLAWLFYVVISVTFGLLASSVVWIEPTSRGSGIPEVKTILGGFVMPNVLSAKTLFMKFIGLMFSVSAGLALGKEGPLVHVACCWSNMLANLSSKYKHNESQRRHLISTGAAAGVSTAFGAPIGGVLFSYEEVSSMFPQKTMIRSFFAAVIAAMTLWQLDATGTGKLTMFQVQLNDPAHPIEYVVFVLLGVLGGLLGAFFCWGNIEFNRGAGIRQTPTRDVFFIILFTSISSYPMLWTANLSSPTIRILFQDCGNVEASDLAKMRALCTGTEPSLDGMLCVQLLCACVIRLIQMTFTFGCAVPCGLFVPSLYTGACLGRVVGIGMKLLAVATGGVLLHPAVVNPGVYAMVGAAAVLGGVCRVTISLVVICLELTGGSQIIPAFMLALLISKWVGDLFTGGIYDMCIELRGYPFLHEEDDVTFNTRACDIMDTDLVCITTNPGTIKELRAELRRHEYSLFPVVSSPEDHQFHGVLHKEEILDFLDKYVRENQTVNEDQVQTSFDPDVKDPNTLPLADHLDHLLLNIVPDTPLAQVHNIFRGLGVKVVIVVRFGKLIGMITKKSFVHSFHHGHIGHIGEDPVLLDRSAQDEQAPKGNALEEALLEGIEGKR